MKRVFLLFSLCISLFSFGGDIYSKTFGKPDQPAIIFLHGGPGYNCASFEATTAEV